MFSVNVPAEADAGRYDGALVLLGIKGAAVQVSFTIRPTPARGRPRPVKEASPGPSGPPAAAKRVAGREGGAAPSGGGHQVV